MQRLGRLAYQRLALSSTRLSRPTLHRPGSAPRFIPIAKSLLPPAHEKVRLFSMSSPAQDQPKEATASASAAVPEPPAPTTSAGEGSGKGPEDPKPAATAETQLPAGSSSEGPSEPELPPLTPREFRIYNRLAEHMDYFHEHFRQSWNILYNACISGKRPANMTLKQFLDEGLSLIRYLEAHHSIEETYLFPILARKMPQFRSGKGKGASELLRQHRQIHAGMDVLEEYLRRCRAREADLELPVMKSKMDSWGPVLLRHLDQEVDTLGAENMRKYWTPEEMRAIPI